MSSTYNPSPSEFLGAALRAFFQPLRGFRHTNLPKPTSFPAFTAATAVRLQHSLLTVLIRYVVEVLVGLIMFAVIVAFSLLAFWIVGKLTLAPEMLTIFGWTINFSLGVDALLLARFLALSTYRAAHG